MRACTSHVNARPATHPLSNSIDESAPTAQHCEVLRALQRRAWFRVLCHSVAADKDEASSAADELRQPISEVGV
jgi:hypothetical protein